METTSTQLDNYLSQDFSDDYWYDDRIIEACKLVKQLTPSDWSTLNTIWQHRPKHWKIRLAEVLDWGDEEYAIPLLLQLLHNPDDELAITALESLESFELSPATKAKCLQRISTIASISKVDKYAIDTFVYKINQY